MIVRRAARPVLQQIMALERCWTVLGRWLSAHRGDAPAGLELTQPQFHALQFITERRSLRMTDLLVALSVSEAAGARIVEKLLRASLVSRHLDPADRRALWVEPTPHGRQIVAVARRKRVAEFKRLLEPLDPDEREEFIRLSEKIAERLRRRGSGAPDESAVP